MKINDVGRRQWNRKLQTNIDLRDSVQRKVQSQFAVNNGFEVSSRHSSFLLLVFNVFLRQIQPIRCHKLRLKDLAMNYSNYSRRMSIFPHTHRFPFHHQKQEAQNDDELPSNERRCFSPTFKSSRLEMAVSDLTPLFLSLPLLSFLQFILSLFLSLLDSSTLLQYRQR